ncbi:MAG: hypothetical protein IPN42_04830 [Methylococcaceae bacterium]|nr:hypothetical protein [Methylococcaceae bacterium]
MAAKTKIDWAIAKGIWESDDRDGFDWISNQYDNVVSRQAISKRAKSESWVKRNLNVAQQSKATLSKLAQPSTQLLKKQVVITRPNKAALIAEGIDVPLGGRDTLYKSEYNEKAYELCLMGATDDVLAHVFGVSEQTLNNWKVQYPVFLESIHAGKDFADAKMANAMYKSGLGLHVVTEDKLVYKDGVAEIVTLEKQLPPEVKAQIHWLNNRQSKKWRNNIIVDNGVKLDPETINFLSGEFEDRLRAIRENAAKLREERGLTINGVIVRR